MTATTRPIEARSLSKSYNGEPAVDSIDLDVSAGEIHAIVGLNGAGKTSLMRMLLGMIRPDGGQALLLGTDVRTDPRAIWAQVGHLIETPFAYPELSVAGNLRAAALLHGLAPGGSQAAIDAAIDMFELARWADRKARTLSLGNRQRLGLASALIHDPAIVILDEPVNALDPAGVVFVREMLRERADRGAAVLVSSHHLDEIARIADRITLMHRGRALGNLDPGEPDLERGFFEVVYEADLAMGARLR